MKQLFASPYHQCKNEYNESCAFFLKLTLLRNLRNQSYSHAVEYPPDLNAPHDWIYLIAIVLVIAGVTGNLLVCLAVSLDQKLHNLTNYFLLSLSIADLLVCLVVMPFGAITGFLGYWPFPVEWCNIYVTCDVLGCSCSIIHMCFISIGRYMGIRNPLKTRITSKRQVVKKIALCWIFSMAITSPITVLALVEPRTIMREDKNCVIHNNYYKIFGSLCAFYIPMVTMIVAYVLTLYLLQKKAILDRHQGDRKFRKCGNKDYHSSLDTRLNEEHRCSRSIENIQERDGIPLSSHLFPYSLLNKCDQATQTEKKQIHLKRTIKLRLNCSSSSFPFMQDKRRTSLSIISSVANERKASKVLGLVFLAFVVCWAPFFILNIITAACSSCYVSSIITELSLWLGYFSSTLNPIIYTIFNKNFRRAFLKLIMCNCEYQIQHYKTVSISENNANPQLPSNSLNTLYLSRLKARETIGSSGVSYFDV